MVVPFAAMSDSGLFGPGSLMWRVNREGALLLGGGRALLLQVAHPLVAAGVAQHSNYAEDPWGRLYRTLDLVTRIVFGSTEEAEEASARIWRVHTRVKGMSEEGVPYEANDPVLLMWVHATLVDTSVLVYTKYIGTLTQAEREAYYEEQMLLGEKFGVPRDQQPQSYREFNEYFDEVVHGGTLRATPELRAVAEATLRPDLPFVARPAVEALNFFTAAHLPEWLREELGMSWGPNRRRLDAASRAMVRGVLPVLPRLLRDFPLARTADRRVRNAA